MRTCSVSSVKLRELLRQGNDHAKKKLHRFSRHPDRRCRRSARRRPLQLPAPHRPLHLHLSRPTPALVRSPHLCCTGHYLIQRIVQYIVIQYSVSHVPDDRTGTVLADIIVLYRTVHTTFYSSNAVSHNTARRTFLLCKATCRSAQRNIMPRRDFSPQPAAGPQNAPSTVMAMCLF